MSAYPLCLKTGIVVELEEWGTYYPADLYHVGNCYVFMLAWGHPTYAAPDCMVSIRHKNLWSDSHRVIVAERKDVQFYPHFKEPKHG